jgi:hypothetical protein
VVFNFLVDRVPLCDLGPRPVTALAELEPRPIKTITAPAIVAPKPAVPRTNPAQQIAQAAMIQAIVPGGCG